MHILGFNSCMTEDSQCHYMAAASELATLPLSRSYVRALAVTPAMVCHHHKVTTLRPQQHGAPRVMPLLSEPICWFLTLLWN